MQDEALYSVKLLTNVTKNTNLDDTGILNTYQKKQKYFCSDRSF